MRISRKRSLVDYPFVIMKSEFHFSHTLVTPFRTVRMKFVFSRIYYNLFALGQLKQRVNYRNFNKKLRK